MTDSDEVVVAEIRAGSSADDFTSFFASIKALARVGKPFALAHYVTQGSFPTHYVRLVALKEEAV